MREASGISDEKGRLTYLMFEIISTKGQNP